MTDIAPIQEIIEEMRAGRMVVLVDEEDRENEGDLVCAAEFVTAEKINFMAKHGRGLICLTLTQSHCEQLNLPLMVSANGLALATNFTVSIEAATGVTTGISAADRARTILVAADKNAKPADIVQPGHIFPLRAQNGGVLVRAGHTEAGCDLAQLAGLTPASVICEILKDDGEMARLPDLVPFAKQHGLKIGTIADLIEYRSQHEKLIERVGQRTVQTAYGTLDLVTYTDKTTQQTHLALVKGDIQPQQETLVRVHEPLSVLDFLEQASYQDSTSVHDALSKISQSAAGVLVLLHHTETSANLLARAAAKAEGHHAQWDPRNYGIGAQILRDLNVGNMRLLGTPRKMPSMVGFGLEVVGYCSANGHGKVAAHNDDTRHAHSPHLNPLPEGEEANESRREFHVKEEK
ncbi:MAG: 3,4-dihydroxy-2-butanone-4-phosphate synthase [Pseudomonadota bacterium]|jgi:3,4-dihydroxy 2-butanone 4-phosphate synthase/GTP cyclohydrolase II